MPLGQSTVTLSVVVELADKAYCSIRFMLIPLWLLVKNAEGEDVFGRHSRTQEQTKEEARASRLDITPVDTNTTLIEAPQPARKPKLRFSHIPQSDTKNDRPQTAPH